MDQPVMARVIRFGNLSATALLYAIDGFGRLPLLLPERGALNLKAFCPGLISPFSPGAFISRPPVLPGVFISGSPRDALCLGEPSASQRTRTAAASSRPVFLGLENSCTEAPGASAATSLSTRRRTVRPASRESLSALVSSTCMGFPVGRN